MARIVELCGLAGAGKSTIFQGMITHWSTNARWIPAQFLFPQEKLKFDSLSKFILSLEKKFTTSEGNIDERTMKKYGDRFLALNPDFIDACWNNIFSTNQDRSKGSDLRYDKARYLYMTFQKVQFLQENQTHKTTVLDEGLVHRVANGFYRQDNPDDEKGEIYNLLNLMPVPDALVYIETDVEEVARRLLNRKKVTISHQDLSLEELEKSSRLALERMAIVLQNLKNRDVPILYVNSKAEIGTNAKAIINFAEKLNKGAFVS
jgi:adenylate kinase